MNAEEVFSVLDERQSRHEAKCDERQRELHRKLDEMEKHANVRLSKLERHVYVAFGAVLLLQFVGIAFGNSILQGIFQ